MPPLPIRPAEEDTVALLAHIRLTDTHWEIIREKDGIRVSRIRRQHSSTAGSYVLKEFLRQDYAREIKNYRILHHLGIQTLSVLAQTDSALLLEDLESSKLYRLGCPEDLRSPVVAQAVAKWYLTLHRRGYAYVEQYGNGMYDETDCITPANLLLIREKSGTQTNPLWNLVLANYPRLRSILNATQRTLVYNDFYYTNLAVARDGSSAFLFDYNLLGKGLPYADLSNVSFIGDADRVFRDAYGDFDRSGRLIVEVVSPLAALYAAYRRSVILPGESANWINCAAISFITLCFASLTNIRANSTAGGV